MKSNLNRNVLPQCLTCRKLVDSGTAELILNDQDEVAGHKIRYECHGETATFDVTDEWFRKFGTTSKFMTDVFPEVAKNETVTAGQAIRESQNQRLRARRDSVREFVIQTIQKLAVADNWLTDDLDKWAASVDLSIVQKLPEILAKSDIWAVTITKKKGVTTYLGQFVIPFYADEGEPQWIPG